MAFVDAHLVHTDEAALVESSSCRVENGSIEPPETERSRSSAGERLLHTQDVTGSIPVVTTVSPPRATLPIFEILSKRRGPVPKDSCSVYVIANGYDLMKIGMSRNPKLRLDSLRTGSAVHIEIAREWRLRTREQARTMEAELHRLFKPVRAAREWFAISVEDVASAFAAVAAGEQDRAEALADAICRERALLARQVKLSNQLSALNNRWHGSRRMEIMHEIEGVLDAMVATRAEARALGRESSEIDKAFGM